MELSSTFYQPQTGGPGATAMPTPAQLAVSGSLASSASGSASVSGSAPFVMLLIIAAGLILLHMD